MLEALAFLAAHADLIDDIVNAIAKGVSKDALKKSIRDTMIAASDAEMQRELGS